jgi:hypothetical protein
MPAVFLLGDSLMAGNNDTTDTTTGALGFAQRGLENVNNGFSIPWHLEAVGGHGMLLSRLDNGWRGRGVWKYCTHLFSNLCSNDIAAGSSIATIQQDYINLWTAAKRTMSPYGKPLKTAAQTTITRTTSNRKLAAAPTIAAGGTGYASSSTFNVTLAGGTLKAGESATTISVTTNGSGVVVTVNGIVNNGIYTSAPASTNSPTGGSGTGLSLTCSFGGWFSQADQQTVAGFEPGGKADQINAWLKTQVGNGLLDALIDYRDLLQDTPSALWKTDGNVATYTDDGVHMVRAGHILAATRVNDWARLIAP